MDTLALDIRPDDLSGAPMLALLASHLRNMQAITPEGSVHALKPEQLKSPGLSFWGVWRGEELVGCGALRELDATHGEIKSMRTVTAHLRRGVGHAMLRHLLDEARRRGYTRVSLETGASDSFAAAHRLYASMGFTPCGPFGDYRADPNSVFMTRSLAI